MDSLNAIRNRINAVTETKKITNAMKLVSSSRIKRIMKTLSYNTRYFDAITAAMRDIAAEVGLEGIDHPFFRGHEHHPDGVRRAYIVFAGDKAMVGSYNRDLLEYAGKILKAQTDPSLVTVGTVARKYFQKNPLHSKGYLVRYPLDVTLHSARNLAANINDMYAHEYIDELYLIYTAFFGKHKGRPVQRQLLPLDRSEALRQEASCEVREILYLPSAKETFDNMVPQYLISILFDVLVQDFAGEQFARMNAMEASTRSADELLKKLRLRYNLARQASITSEIAEISAGSRSMEEMN